jgi:hypothetical protein
VFGKGGGADHHGIGNGAEESHDEAIRWFSATDGGGGHPHTRDRSDTVDRRHEVPENDSLRKPEWASIQTLDTLGKRHPWKPVNLEEPLDPGTLRHRRAARP